MIRHALPCLAFLLASATVAFAQPEPRDIGVFPNGDTSISTWNTVAFVPFDVHVVVFDPDDGVAAFELGVQVEPTFIVSGTSVRGGCELCLYDLDALVGVPGDCVGEFPEYTVVTMTLLAMAPVVQDGLVCVTGASPSLYELGGVAGYQQCDDDLVPFGLAQNGGEFYPDGCLVINPTHPLEGPVALEDIGMGTLKARFQPN